MATFDLEAVTRRVIAEFRATGGNLNGEFRGASLLLLTTTGARSGKPLTTPVFYSTDGPRLVVAASRGGAPRHPAWYHNLIAHPIVGVELGAEQFRARATVVGPEERTRLYRRHAEAMPSFVVYQALTERLIPVVTLERCAP